MDMEWQPQGKCETCIQKDVYRIFPKNKKGEQVPIWVKRVFLHVRRKWTETHTSELNFKYYKHRSNYYWRDSRDESGSCSRFHVRDELARLLFEGNKDQAQRFMDQVKAMI